MQFWREPFFYFDLKLSSECHKLPFEGSLLKFECLLLSFGYKKVIWCCVLVCMCVNSKWHQLCEDHSVKKTVDWILPTECYQLVFWKYKKHKLACQQLSDWSEISENLAKRWGKDLLLKLFKKGMPIWKAKTTVMEKELYTMFLDMRREDKRVERCWFNSKARQLLKEKYLTKRPSLSYHTYDWVSFRRKTHAAQKSTAALRIATEKFHAKSLRAQKRNFHT